MNEPSGESRKAREGGQGVVFTPPELARRLAEPLLASLEPGTPILDPACGNGALLLAALEGLGGGPEAAERLHGIEIEPRLVELARIRLAAARCGTATAAAASERCWARSRPAAVGGRAGRSQEGGNRVGRIRVADALDPETPWPAGAAILANPPWISFSGRQAGSARDRASLRRPGGGWPSLQGAFLERIARHCGLEGTPARILLPASVLELEGYAPLREAISSYVHPATPPEELGEDAFPGVIEPAVILTLAPGPAVPPVSWSAPPPDKCNFLRGLERLPKLPPRTFADPGVHTGNSAAQLVSTEPRPGWAPLRRGADLAPYALGPPSLWLRLDLQPGPEQRFRYGTLERYRGFPVLLRQTADRPIAALHTEPTYFRNSLLAVREVPGLHPAFLVALLNSEVTTRWHRSLFQDARQRTFPQVKVRHLQTLPTPIERREQDRELHDSIVEAVTRLDPKAPGFAGALRWIEGRMKRAFDEALRDPGRWTGPE